MNEALLELYRHKTWATLRLIEHCQGLGDEHLDATIPGTYGTIRDTLRHLVLSEEGYFMRVTGERSYEHLPEAGPVPMDELAEHIRRLGPRWEAVAQDPEAPNREVTTSDGWRLPATVVMAQAIHHADDHRSHVLSILGARGLQVPVLDVWAYGESAGQMHLDPSRKFSATVHTSHGEFVIALDDPKINPEAVTRFVYLAQDNFYDGLTFHRVVPSLVVQGGDRVGNETDGPASELPHKSSPSEWRRGTVGMKSSEGGTIGSPFFITLSDAAFPETSGVVYHHLGEVSSGMEVVDKIQVGDAMTIEITAS